VARDQLAGLGWAIKYIAEAVYYHFMVGSKDVSRGRGEMTTQGVEQQERWEIGMGMSEAPREEVGEVQEGYHEDPKD